MVTSNFGKTFLLLLSLTACGCFLSPAQEMDQRAFPIQFETIHETSGYAFASDLDGDGSDEFISIQHSLDLMGAGRHLGYIRIEALGSKVIEQVNYPGLILASSLHFLDIDEDGLKEILVPYIINDSLFVSFISASGQKLFHFFLIEGKPRKEEGGDIAWDPSIRHFHLADIDGDHHDDLVTVIATGYARLPRGVLVHTFPAGKLLGKTIVGAHIREGFFGDFDNDQNHDFVVGSGATNNGASAGGFDDQHAYLINFSLQAPPRVTWSKELGAMWNLATLHHHDLDADGKKELLCVTTGSAPTQKAQIEVIEPGTWQVKRQRIFNQFLNRVVVMDLDRDFSPEIVVASAAGEVWILDQQLEIKKRRKMVPVMGSLAAVPDLDGDGIDDLLLAASSQGFWLSPDLDIKAIFPRFEMVSSVQTGIGKKPHLLVTWRDRNQAQVHSVLLRQLENPYYLWYRYGRTTLGIISVLAVLGLGVSFVILLRNHRRETAMQDLAFDSDGRGLLFLRSNGTIVRWNHHLFSCLQQHQRNIQRGCHFTQVFKHPELLDFLQTALQPPCHRHETKMIFPVEQTGRMVHIIVDPLTMRGHSSPYWLVQFLDKTVELEIYKARIWNKMAQRIAHDIKNPLTSILLTQQRLQMEYRERSPAHAMIYDNYSSKIIERIEALRLMTRNFMKLVNLEKLHLADSALHPFLQITVQHLSKNIPPDVHLDLKLNGHDETVGIDHDQIKVLLENLVSNALNAMPQGGKITITTSLAKGLQLIAISSEPADYAVIEISDTGKGMSPDILEKIFEPNFSTSENGVGLGLAIVKKIVEGHHGHIEVESEVGAGTIFSVYLPVK